MSGHRALRLLLHVDLGRRRYPQPPGMGSSFRILVLIENFVFKSDPPAPLDRVVDEEKW